MNKELFKPKPVNLSKIMDDIEIPIKNDSRPIQRRGKKFSTEELKFLN